MTEHKPICPMCEEGHLSPICYSDALEHRGQELRVDNLEAYLCDACDADPVFEDQIRRNHRRVVDAKRRADGLLTGDEIQALRQHLHLTQKEASVVFGGGPNAFSKYERGDVVQSAAMDRLLKLAFRFPFLLGELRREAGLAAPAEAWTPATYETTVAPARLKVDQGHDRPLHGHRVVVEMEEWRSQRNRAA